jgi:cobalamin biosynthesis protein CobD/CbiB
VVRDHRIDVCVQEQGQMNDDENAAIDGLCEKLIEQRDRIKALKAALRDIANMKSASSWTAIEAMQTIARVALAGEQDKSIERPARSLGKEIARLMDKHGIAPAAKPQFWIELEALAPEKK